MNCTQFRRNLPDWITERLEAGRQAEMIKHRAACPECARCEVVERDLRAAWQNLPAPPAPDLWPRLHARLQAAAAPAPRSRPATRLAFVGSVCAALAVAIWLPFAGGRGAETAAKRPANVVVALPDEHPPLEEMLEGVRWQSSEERETSLEPPAYSEEMRAALLVGEGT